MHSPHLVRPRLNERLARATQYPIALIVAPAGFGKSLALRDFVTASASGALRFDVRREERSLLAFARRFADVLEPVAPSAAASFPALQERLLAAAEPPRLVCDWLAEHLKDVSATIVVDDLHFAAVDPDAISSLAELMERTCDRIAWTVASRTDAGLPIASWLAYGRTGLIVDERDLSFTLDEALEAAELERSGMDPGDVETLWQLTAGWPVALTLAIRTHTQAAALRPAGTREMIYRYLAEQVFARVTPAQRTFLLATSVFPEFDIAVAAAMGGSSEFVAELRRDIGFLTEVSPGRFRYHDLFRDYLDSELVRSGEEAHKIALSTGARALEERGNVAGALALYAKAKDTEPVLRVLEAHGFSLFERGQVDSLSAALEALPDDVRRASPAALGLQATVDAARGYIEPASSAFLTAIERADRDDLRLFLVHRYAIELVRQDRDCIGLLETHANDDRVPAELRVPLMGTLATAYVRASREKEAVATVAKALDLLSPSAPDDVRARLYQQAAFVYSRESEYERARRYATQAVELALARSLFDVAVRAYSVLYAITYDEKDDPIACLSILEKLLDFAGKAGSTQGRLYGLIASFGIEADRGNEAALDRIEAELAEIPEMLAENRSEVLFPVMALRAAWRGEFKKACELFLQAGQHQSDERRAEDSAEYACYAFASGMREEANVAIKNALAALDRCPRSSRRTLRARLFLSFVELMRNRPKSAHRQLAFVKRDLDATMPRLAALASAATVLYRRAIGRADVQLVEGAFDRLRMAQFGGIARLLETLPFPASAAAGYATLTATEREILHMLAAGGSTRDLAAKSSRSPRTIDTHIRSICKKLRCNSRRAAVAIAIGSGWVENEP